MKTWIKHWLGPPRIPIVGSYLLLFVINQKSLHRAVLKLCDYYKSKVEIIFGNFAILKYYSSNKVIGFYSGSILVVVANDYKSVKEMLLRQEFDGRADILSARSREPNYKLNGKFKNSIKYFSATIMQYKIVLKKNCLNFNLKRKVQFW